MVTQDERLEELKSMQQVNAPARLQRGDIEKDIETDPYFDYLYNESKFDQLMFLELRRQTTMLQAIVKLLSDKREGTSIEVCKEPGKSIAQIMFEHNEGPCGEPAKLTPPDASVIIADSNADRKTTPRKPTTKKPVTRKR